MSDSGTEDVRSKPHSSIHLTSITKQIISTFTIFLFVHLSEGSELRSGIY